MRKSFWRYLTIVMGGAKLVDMGSTGKGTILKGKIFGTEFWEKSH